MIGIVQRFAPVHHPAVPPCAQKSVVAPITQLLNAEPNVIRKSASNPQVRSGFHYVCSREVVCGR